MLVPAGFVSLAELWKEFVGGRWGKWSQDRAIESYETTFGTKNTVTFGTALDLTEDLFRLSFDDFRFALSTPSGDVQYTTAVLQDDNNRVLAKLSVQESLAVARDKTQAGVDGKWLWELGSRRFREINQKIHSMSLIRPKDKSVWEGLLRQDYFSTLPILFEREAYVLVSDLPPWTDDLLYDSYLRNIWLRARGASICLPESDAARWRKSLKEPHLRRLLSLIVWTENPGDGAKGGRPDKKRELWRAYQELALANSSLPRKEQLRRVEEHLGSKSSVSTLTRAIKEGESQKKLSSSHE